VLWGVNRSICRLGCKLEWAEGSTSSIVFVPMCPPMWAYWRHLANTIEPSVCGGDAVLCQITLTTCSFLSHSSHLFYVLLLLYRCHRQSVAAVLFHSSQKYRFFKFCSDYTFRVLSGSVPVARAPPIMGLLGPFEPDTLLAFFSSLFGYFMGFCQ